MKSGVALPKKTLLVEPGSRYFRIRDLKGQFHRLSAYLLQEAETGDGTVFPEDLTGVASPPPLTEVRPWGPSAGVADFAAARLYLRLLRKRFGGLFVRPRWRIVLSPWRWQTQAAVWRALLREASLLEYSFSSNLASLASRETGPGASMFVHWGASGGDMGVCLQGELFRYRRIEYGEEELLRAFSRIVGKKFGVSASLEEAIRIVCLTAEHGLWMKDERLIEVSTANEERVSLSLSSQLEEVLGLLEPVLEAILSFLRALESREQAELFQNGLQLSGGALTLPLVRQALSELLEIPVTALVRPASSVLESPAFPVIR